MPYIKEHILRHFPTSRLFAQHLTANYGPGWDEGMVSRLVNGRCFPTQEIMAILCRELHCGPGDLYTVDELRQMVEMGTAGLVDKLTKEGTP